MKNPFKSSGIEDTKLDVTIEDKEDTENKEVFQEETSETTQEESNEINNSNENTNSELQEKYDTLNNQYIRLAADFDNYRKRNEQEREALLKYGAENTLKKMLEVLDNFERGLKAIEGVEDCDKVKECYNLAYKNLTDVLTKAGLQIIKAEGEEFDPNFHEAVMQTPTSEKPENTVLAELQRGYMLEGKVLRPALVSVAVPE